MKGPLASEGREPVLPTDMQLNECFFSNGADDQSNEGDQSTLAPGVVELHFARPAGEFDERMVYASIVYSVMGFWPGVEGVRIYLGDEIVYPGDVPGVQTRRSVFKREDFAGVLGHTATLAFPDQDGLGLYPVLRCMGQDTVYDPRMRRTALFAGTADLGVWLTMFQPEDVLSVSIHGQYGRSQLAHGVLRYVGELCGKRRFASSQERARAHGCFRNGQHAVQYSGRAARVDAGRRREGRQEYRISVSWERAFIQSRPYAFLNIVVLLLGGCAYRIYDLFIYAYMLSDVIAL